MSHRARHWSNDEVDLFASTSFMVGIITGAVLWLLLGWPGIVGGIVLILAKVSYQAGWRAGQ